MAEENSAGVIEITMSIIVKGDRWWNRSGRKEVIWQQVYAPGTSSKICTIVKGGDIISIFVGDMSIPILLGGSILIERRVI